MLKGIGNTEGVPGSGDACLRLGVTDADIARLAGYLRRTRTNLPPWTDLENKVAAIRGEPAASR